MGVLNVKSLREQVYEYIRDEMCAGRLRPGTTLNLNQISTHLGISKTPLRDALIRLEVEGFVTILPRRGVIVNALSLQDVKDIYQICGALEGDVIQSVFDRFNDGHLDAMRRLNVEMHTAIKQAAFEKYYNLNIAFHDVFLNLSDNQKIRAMLMPLKQRLYDFQRLPYVKAWELRNLDEHDQFIASIIGADVREAVRLLRDVHWSFRVQEDFIRAYHEQHVDAISTSQPFDTE